MTINSVSKSQGIDFEALKQQLENTAKLAQSGGGESPKSGNKTEFLNLLEKGIQEINTSSKVAEKASMDLASGKSSNIHETMLAVTKAELGFSMMVQLRNKMIEAYQDVMRMQI